MADAAVAEPEATPTAPVERAAAPSPSPFQQQAGTPRDDRQAVRDWLAGDRGKSQFGVAPERWDTATTEEVAQADALAA